MNFNSMLTILYTIITFSVIIFVHEFGHFIFSKIFGVYVHEFAVGMGPAIFKKKKGETLYSVRAIPMGGYCKLEGEDGNSTMPGSLSSINRFKKFIILFAGSFMNFVLGFLVVITLFSFYTPGEFASTTISNVIENTAAYDAGIKSGDKIIYLDNHKINFNNDFYMYNTGNTVNLTVKRGNEKLKFTVTPRNYLLDKNGNIIKESNEEGSYKLLGIQFGKEKKTFLSVIKNSWYQSILFGKTIFLSFTDMIKGKISVDQLSGPVGIVKEINTAATNGFDYLLYIIAIISINLGICNLFPLPALDGGRIVFVIIESIIRRPIPEKYEAIIHTVGFLLLIILMLFVTGNDILRIFGGK